MKLKVFTIKSLMFVITLILSVGSVLAQGSVRKSDYRKNLSDFCKNEFIDCFEGYIFQNNSLTVTDVTPNGNNCVLVEGRISYRDDYDKKHTGMRYVAEIETIGTEVQRIVFRLEHVADRTHTKPYWISCTKLMGQRQKESEILEANQQNIRYYTQLLNDFCEANYSKCFSGRTYTSNSLVVNSVTIDKITGAVNVEGTHTYVGRTGTSYRGYKFTAKIREGRETTKIEFQKESAADFTHSSNYWEECTKSF